MPRRRPICTADACAAVVPCSRISTALVVTPLTGSSSCALTGDAMRRTSARRLRMTSEREDDLSTAIAREPRALRADRDADRDRDADDDEPAADRGPEPPLLRDARLARHVRAFLRRRSVEVL